MDEPKQQKQPDAEWKPAFERHRLLLTTWLGSRPIIAVEDLDRGDQITVDPETGFARKAKA